DDDAAVRQDAKAAGRIVVQLRVLLAIAGGTEAQERALKAIDEPEPAGMPARALKIAAVIEQDSRSGRCLHLPPLQHDLAARLAGFQQRMRALEIGVFCRS